MIRQFDLKKSEVVPLNNLVDVRQLYTSKGLAVIRGLYFAAPDGIYIAVNRHKRAGKVFGLIALFFALLLLVPLLGLGIFIAGAYWEPAGNVSVIDMRIAGIIIGTLIDAPIAYGIYKLVKVMLKSIRGPDIIEGELVAPWSIVRNIIVTDLRTENTKIGLVGIMNPNYMDVGTFRVILTNGGEIDIWPVYDPYNKLNYIKNKFNLSF